ncbi:hypothetical protein OAL14_05770 [Gammaproteobacteria bacterium]|nr:hypothetical protein [Gammaproteobacteria bacterium]
MNTTKKDAFAKFGVKQKNQIWSWSGISEDQQTLVLTLWSDQYQWNKETRIHEWTTFGCNNELWHDRNGNKYRIADIQHSLDHLDGRFRAIRIEPNETLLPEREIIKVQAIVHLEWQITEFDPNTGECAGRSYAEKRLFEAA